MLSLTAAAIGLTVAIYGAGSSWRARYMYCWVPICPLLIIFTGTNLWLRAGEFFQSKLFLGSILCASLCYTLLLFQALLAPLPATPFQSKFLYFVVLGSMGLAGIMLTAIAGLQGDIYDMSWAQLVWRCLVRTGRYLDSATDCGMSFGIWLLLREARCWTGAAERKCPELWVMFAISVCGGTVSIAVALLLIMWPGSTKRRNHLALVCVNFLAQVALLSITAVLGVRSVQSGGAPAIVNDRQFLLLSASFTVATFVTNLIGLRRIAQHFSQAANFVVGRKSVMATQPAAPSGPDVIVAGLADCADEDLATESPSTA